MFLSAIPGVAVYATKAAAMAGQVDSGAAFNAWMRTQTGSLTILWDGWIYVADMPNDYLQTTPGMAGCTTIHRLGDATASGGAVWATKTTSSPCMLNGAWTNNTIGTESLKFQPNAGGSKITFDFNANNDSQPHNDSTWGFAMGIQSAGLLLVEVSGAIFMNSRTFCFFALTCGTVRVSGGSGCNYTTTILGENHDGWHCDGCDVIDLNTFYVTNTGDDSIAVITDEPNVAEFYKGIVAGWTGRNTTSVSIRNATFNNGYQGIRLLTSDGTKTIGSVLIDGLSGSINGYFIRSFNDVSSGAHITNIGQFVLRNMSLVDSGAFPAYEHIRLYLTSSTGLFEVDFDTITPVAADGPSTVIMMQVADVGPLPSSIVFGSRATRVFSDNFTRADSATVGNGWTQDGTKWSIASNKLHAAVDEVDHTITRPGFVNGMLTAVWTLGTAAASNVGIYVRGGYMWNKINGSLDMVLYDHQPGGGYTGLRSYSTLSVSTSLKVFAAAVNTFIIGAAYDTQNSQWSFPPTTYVDSTYTAAGVCGLYDYMTTNPADCSLVTVDIYPVVLDTLSLARHGADIVLTFSRAGASSYQISRDGGAFTTQTSPKTYTGDALALHTYVVLALDASGNVLASGTVNYYPADAREQDLRMLLLLS